MLPWSFSGSGSRLRNVHEKITHEPILNYETAEKVDKELGLTGTETKTLFLKG